jgi:uncharacterized oxidoreductase
MRKHETKIAFVTGGGSGIGAALARVWHQRGAKVVIAGRNLASLQEVASGCPGMETCELDVSDADSVARATSEVKERWPEVDTVVNNAGIQSVLRFDEGGPLKPEKLLEEVDINLKGVLLVTNALLPLLKERKSARLINVSSGLAFVPLVAAPVYSATKAAVHAFTVALREQLRGTSVQVVELIPPAVETQLHRGQLRRPPGAMPLDEFTREAVKLLDSGKEELAVGRARMAMIGSRVAPKRMLALLNRVARA